MKRYMQFSKKKFEFELINIRKACHLYGWEEVSEQIDEENSNEMKSWEYIYAFPTRNKNVKILIYSSIDKRTDMCREHGSDAVRLVYRWEAEDGIWYRSIGKHLRINTLFENLEVSVWNAECDCFEVTKTDDEWYSNEYEDEEESLEVIKPFSDAISSGFDPNKFLTEEFNYSFDKEEDDYNKAFAKYEQEEHEKAYLNKMKDEDYYINEYVDKMEREARENCR